MRDHISSVFVDLDESYISSRPFSGFFKLRVRVYTMSRGFLKNFTVKQNSLKRGVRLNPPTPEDGHDQNSVF